MSAVAPQAHCHSVGAGYTFCLFVIPSDSVGARGQTCNPERSLHRKALRTQKTHKLQFRFCLSLFLPTHPSLSSFSLHITVLWQYKMTHGSTFVCPLASFQITSLCFCLSTTQCHTPNPAAVTRQVSIFGVSMS